MKNKNMDELMQAFELLIDRDLKSLNDKHVKALESCLNEAKDASEYHQASKELNALKAKLNTNKRG
jgi:hypothetical protein